MLGADYSFSKPDPKGLKADGIGFVMRYLSPDPAKNLSAAELAQLHGLGLLVGLVWESSAQRALGGVAAGAADARVAKAQRDALGLSHLPIFFAADWDVTDAQKPAVAAYLHGAASVLGHDFTGVYGSFYVVRYMSEHDACKWFWQTYAWSGGLTHPAAHLKQFQNGVKKWGGEYDLNRTVATDFIAVLRGPVVKPSVSPLKRLQWRSNVKVLNRILVNHPELSPRVRGSLRLVRDKYVNALKRR